MVWAKVVTGATLAAIGGLATRYAVQRERLEGSWLAAVGPKLSGIGEVERLSILPLVERLVPAGALEGEPGVSYLLRADDTTILFDVGFNSGHRAQSPLVHNAATLGVDIQSLDGIVISHLHSDHVGGVRSQFRRTFSMSAEALEPKGLPGYVPAPMSHQRADVVLTTGPRVIAPGLPSCRRCPGCCSGRPGGRAGARDQRSRLRPGARERLWPPGDRADVGRDRGGARRADQGGRRRPAPAGPSAGDAYLPQAILGSPHWPWRPIGEQDVAEAIDAICTRGPRMIAVSSHDSTPWTFGAFERAFGERYRTLRVGEELLIS